MSRHTDEDVCMQRVKQMEAIVCRMLNEGRASGRCSMWRTATFCLLGHRFDKPEYIMDHLQQGIW